MSQTKLDLLIERWLWWCVFGGFRLGETALDAGERVGGGSGALAFLILSIPLVWVLLILGMFVASPVLILVVIVQAAVKWVRKP